MFDVIDPHTGKYPDLLEIGMSEEWACSMHACDLGTFFLGEDGTLYIAHEWDSVEVPHGRFKLIFRDGRGNRLK